MRRADRLRRAGGIEIGYTEEVDRVEAAIIEGLSTAPSDGGVGKFSHVRGGSIGMENEK